jgi:hypothetical protein
MVAIIESLLKNEKLVKPVNPDASNYYIPVKSLQFSGKLGLEHEIEMEGRILKVEGTEDYLNSDDLMDLEGMNVRLYLNPAGCGPNDGVFFSRLAYKALDAHSLIPGRYRIRLEIFSIGENPLKENIEITQ